MKGKLELNNRRPITYEGVTLTRNTYFFVDFQNISYSNNSVDIFVQN